MLLKNGITVDRPIISCDWNRTSCDVYDPRTKGVRTIENLEKIAVEYPGTFLVLESTGESYELQRRKLVIEAFKQNDVQAYGYKTQRTAQFRRDNDIIKSNKNDARAIYRVATETAFSLHEFQELIEEDPIRDGIKDFLVEDRYLHDCGKTTEIAEQYLKSANIPEEHKKFIFSGKNYRKQIGRLLAVAVEVRKSKRGYREFRRQIGNYGNGYASMPRSEFYHWLVKSITNKQLDRELMTNLSDLTAKQRRVHKTVMKEATEACKWLWKITGEASNG